VSARRVGTAIGALLLAAVGFGAGAAGSAWQTRDARSAPWRKLRVEHQGRRGESTRTRVVFENPKLAIQAVEVVRDPDSTPEVGHVALREGEELTIRYDDEARPSAIQGPDGAVAELTYKGGKVHVSFVAPSKEPLGDKALAVPAELRGALKLSALPTSPPFESLGSLGISEAWAQDKPAEAEDATVTVERRVAFDLDLRLGGSDPGPVDAEIEASCAPFTCLPTRPSAPAPGKTSLFIAVAGTKKQSELGAPDGSAALAPYHDTAVIERGEAKRALPDIAAVIAAIGVTAIACRSEKVELSVCSADLGKSAAVAGGAVRAVLAHEPVTKGAVVDERARELYFQEQARAAFDKPLKIELCAARDGYARACAAWTLHPFAAEETPSARGTLELKKGIGGTLAGSFFITQSDGADCKFSPSPKTAGSMKLAFDNEKNTATATLKSSERGTRANLSCSLGVANMSFSQAYTITATQTFPKAELEGSGKLPIRMIGSMSGTGSYSFSNCRTSGGGSVNCPAGKSDSYAYPVELVGEIDLATQTGTGRIVVQNAPLSTSGSWRIPAEKAP
jgi:hypothetical protein